MEHLSVEEQLIEEVVSFGDDLEFCIHSKLINESTNKLKRSLWILPRSHSNSNINVDQDSQQIARISKQEGKIANIY